MPRHLRGSTLPSTYPVEILGRNESPCYGNTLSEILINRRLGAVRCRRRRCSALLFEISRTAQCRRPPWKPLHRLGLAPALFATKAHNEIPHQAKSSLAQRNQNPPGHGAACAGPCLMHSLAARVWSDVLDARAMHTIASARR
jgi:hypothetical protein